MLAVKCQWGGFGAPEGMYSEEELAFGIHGGDRETSLMLAFAPQSVDMSRAVDTASSAKVTPVPPIGPVSYGWIATDLSETGIVGEAAQASEVGSIEGVGGAQVHGHAVHDDGPLAAHLLEDHHRAPLGGHEVLADDLEPVDREGGTGGHVAEVRHPQAHADTEVG